MLKSMTGFGRCENATDEYKISVEMKAVNHRYLDLVSRCQRNLTILGCDPYSFKEIYPEREKEVDFLSITRIIQKEISA